MKIIGNSKEYLKYRDAQVQIEEKIIESVKAKHKASAKKESHNPQNNNQGGFSVPEIDI